MKYSGTERCRECGKEFQWKRDKPGGIPKVCSDECRERRRTNYAARYRERMGELPDGDPRHGTLTGYVTFSCGCDKCRVFWRGYRAKQRAKKAAEQG